MAVLTTNVNVLFSAYNDLIVTCVRLGDQEGLYV